jgi:hypothetical protein
VHGDDRPFAIELVDVPPQGPDEPQFVEGGWAQGVDQPPHVVDRAGGRYPELPQLCGGPGRVGGQEVARGVGAEGDAGQHRTQTVVQVTPQAPAFLLTGADDLLPRALHGVREGRRVDDGRERDRKEFERGAIRAVERRLAGPRADQKLADILTPIAQGDRLGPRRRRPALRHDGPRLLSAR